MPCCAEEGDLRLVARVDINGFATGALQVYVGGAFGAVCNSGFSHTEAAVACRQLGFVSGRAIRSDFVFGGPRPLLSARESQQALQVCTSVCSAAPSNRTNIYFIFNTNFRQRQCNISR